MTGLAVVLGLAVLSMAEVAVDRFREVMDRNVRVFLAVGERVASLVDVGVAGQALFRAFRRFVWVRPNLQVS